MVLRDEKERIRLARLSRSIRKETKCCIYRSKLQSYEGEPEIDDVDVYLGLTWRYTRRKKIIVYNKMNPLKENSPIVYRTKCESNTRDSRNSIPYTSIIFHYW